ncbi:MAG TPA: SCO family protein [Bacteroidales bacterium]|nr:SCO family protein [Bacteroidales bacterium]
MIKKGLITILFFALAITGTFAQQKGQLEDQVIQPEDSQIADGEVGVTEHLNDFIPKDVTLVNQYGDTVNIMELVDKPTILNFVYYRCPGICSPLMNGIADFVDQLNMNIAEDYQILTISFDHREGTELAQRKHVNYMKMIEKDIPEDGWTFYTADSTDIYKLTNATGFKFMRTGQDFAHSATLIMLSPEGKITRYLHGTYFLPFEVKMSIVEAAEGKVGSTINRVLQYCYSYDPTGQKYVLNITKITGSFIMIVAVIIFLVLIIKPKNSKENSKK